MPATSRISSSKSSPPSRASPSDAIRIELPALERDRGGVERAAAEVVDHDVALGALLLGLAEVAMGELDRGRGGLVDQADRQEPRAPERLQGQPALARRRVRRHGDHHLERLARSELEVRALEQALAQAREEGGRELERGHPRQAGDRRIGNQRPDGALDRADRVLGGAIGERARGLPPDQELAAPHRRDPGDVLAKLATIVEARERVPAITHGGHHGPGGAEIDAEPHAARMHEPIAGGELTRWRADSLASAPQPELTSHAPSGPRHAVPYTSSGRPPTSAIIRNSRHSRPRW